MSELESLAEKCRVQHPGIDAESFRPASATRGSSNTPQVTWAARWEFDKNPESFFDALDDPALAQRNWNLAVLGQSFRETPTCFEVAREKWSDRISHWGFQATREDFVSALQSTDIFVSSAIHEFFGIGVVEAITAGATPLLPRRLAYPELLQLETSPELQPCFYDDDRDLSGALVRLLEHPNRQSLQARAAAAVARFDWASRSAELDEAIQRATY